MHSKPDKRLISRLNEDLLEEFGSDVDCQAPANQKTLNRIMKLRTLKVLNKLSGGKVDVNFIDSSWSDDGASAQFTTLREVNGEAYTGSDNGSISVYRSAFGTYRETVGVIIHEFAHAYSRHTGFFANNFKKLGNDWNKAIYMDELFAYTIQDRFGFSFYQNNNPKGSYVYGLQKALNGLNLN